MKHHFDIQPYPRIPTWVAVCETIAWLIGPAFLVFGICMVFWG